MSRKRPARSLLLCALIAGVFATTRAQTPAPAKAANPSSAAQRMLYDANGALIGPYFFGSKSEFVMAHFDGFKVLMPVGPGRSQQPNEFVFGSYGSFIYTGLNCTGQMYALMATGGSGAGFSPEFEAYFEAMRKWAPGDDPVVPSAPLYDPKVHGAGRDLFVIGGKTLVKVDRGGGGFVDGYSKSKDGLTCLMVEGASEGGWGYPVFDIIDISKKFVPPFRLK